MKVLELFSGTKSISEAFVASGHTVFTIDNDWTLSPDLCKDMRKTTAQDIPFVPDVIWASPPCTHFSVASIGRNWNKDGSPKTLAALEAQEIVKSTIEFIANMNPQVWFIENPRGMLRKMSFMQELPRKTVTYCQYGDTRMKPTDIWTNATWEPKAMCKNGNPCHDAAPRGSRTGTQGLKGAKERGVIPNGLCNEVVLVCERIVGGHHVA